MLMNNIFDTINIKDILSHIFQCKSLLIPYALIVDPKFSWIKNVFIQYLKHWLVYIKQRDGNFSKADQIQILMSQ